MRPEGVSKGEWMRYNGLFAMEHFLGYRNFLKHFGQRYETLRDTIADRLQQGHRGGVLDLPALRADQVVPGMAPYRDLLRNPVVFREAAADWPAIKKWNIDFFREKFGDYKIYLLDTVGAVDPENPQEFEEVSLAEYLNQLKQGSRKYLKFSSLVQEKMNLRQDLDEEWLRKFEFRGAFSKRYYTFIGGAGTVTPLHNEFPAVVYVQVCGRKKWILYPPEERVFFDPRTERRVYFYSEANPKNPADDRYPLFGHSKRFEITLEPGDVLWFPPFAWHYVENLTDSIAVAYKFSHFPAALKASKALTSLYLMATRPNLLANFIQHRFTKRHVDARKAIIVNK